MSDSQDSKRGATVIDLESAKTQKKGDKCPVCAKPVQEAYKPFCSKRCADIDLGKWLKEGYRIPTDEVPGETPGPFAPADDEN